MRLVALGNTIESVDRAHNKEYKAPKGKDLRLGTGSGTCKDMALNGAKK